MTKVTLRNNFPTPDELSGGHIAYLGIERRDSIYRVATYLVDVFWGRPMDLADGIGVLLHAWNARFTNAYGGFDYDSLERCIQATQAELDLMRGRSIRSLTSADEAITERLFAKFMVALKSQKREAYTPVGTSKTLHLLAPSWFPLWDDAIAKELGFYWYSPERAPQKYARFQRRIAQISARIPQSAEQALAEAFEIFGKTYARTLLKVIDEYFYVNISKETAS